MYNKPRLIHRLKGVGMIILTGLMLILVPKSGHGQNPIDGSWKGEATGPTNQHFPLIFTFHTQDTLLTGSMISPMGNDTIILRNGTIRGNELYFDIAFGKLFIHHSGELRGDSIYIKTADRSGGGMSFTLGRITGTQ
ncbi:MAG TPA: hypothetical protein VNE41_11490 [Chitinophagaceae bacterium]|nr:hypothetical protein [Chitinophagaceae bacterium]